MRRVLIYVVSSPLLLMMIVYDIIKLPILIFFMAPILGLLASIAIGAISGVWPARRAARLNPVVALAYE